MKLGNSVVLGMHTAKPYVYMVGKKRPGAQDPVATQKQMDEARALIARFLAPDDKDKTPSSR